MARLFSLIFLSLVLTSVAQSNGKTDFIQLVENICQTPCGIEPEKDQKEREEILFWIKRYESQEKSSVSNLTQEICQWIENDAKLAYPKFTPEKKAFIRARLKEKKSSLIGIFCSPSTRQ